MFRRYLHKHARQAIAELPAADPLSAEALPPRIPSRIVQAACERYPATTGWLASWAADPHSALATCPVEHAITPIAGRGGREAGLRELADFVEAKLDRYSDRNHPAADSASGLSPYLHWGHISTHEIVHAIINRDPQWDIAQLPERWQPRGLLAAAARRPTADGRIAHLARTRLPHGSTPTELHQRFDSLPGWARNSLAIHASDPRPVLYSLETLESAETDDPLWNAAQRQLRDDGIIHNYLRMLWAKKILEWSPSPEVA